MKKATIITLGFLALATIHALINIFVFKRDFRCFLVAPIWAVIYAIYFKVMITKDFN